MNHRTECAAPIADEAALLTAYLPVLTGVRDLTGAQIDELRASLVEAAVALDVADPFEPHPLFDRFGAHRLELLTAAIEARARRMIGAELPAPPLGAPRFTGRRGGGGLTKARVAPLVDVNSCSIDELAAVPGLGQASARRIVASRPYRRVADVRRRAGLSGSAWEEASAQLLLKRDGGRGRLCADGSAAVPTAVRALAEGRLEHPLAGPTRNLGASGVDVVAWCCREIAADGWRPPMWTPSAARLDTGQRASDRRQDPQRFASVRGVALVRSGSYLPFVGELIDHVAERQLLVRMFYVAAGREPDAAGPVDELLDRLAAARERGVDVRLILADTLAADVRGAARVNAAAIPALARRGLPVRRWWPEVALHEKSLVIDGRHVIAGSHNWTANSFFQADETSLYADSTAMGGALVDRFEAAWAALADEPGERRIALRMLQQLDPALLAALAAHGFTHGDELPCKSADVKKLATDVACPSLELTALSRCARLMRELRIAEPTAAALVCRGLDSAAKVRATPEPQLRAALATPGELPRWLRGREVSPDVASLLVGGR